MEKFPFRFRAVSVQRREDSADRYYANPINGPGTLADSAFFRRAMECSRSMRADKRCSNGDDTRT